MVSLLTLLASSSLVAAVASASQFNVSTVNAHCEDIYAFTGDAGLEAPTKVVNVTLVPANTASGVPAYCSVLAKVASIGGSTTFLAYLPASGGDWSGTFVQHGCGGSCGAVGLDYIYGYGYPSTGFGRDAVKKGYMISVNDMGHDNAVTVRNLRLPIASPCALLKIGLRREILYRHGTRSATTKPTRSTLHSSQRMSVR